MPSKGKNDGERWVLRLREVRRALAEKGWRSPSPMHHPSPAKELSPRREVDQQLEEAEKQVEEAKQLEDVGRLLSHCQPDSWPRWLWRLDHLCWVRRSQSGGSSDLLWEAKSPRRNSIRLVKLRRPGSSILAQLLFGRSGSSKRAPRSSLGNSPSCS